MPSFKYEGYNKKGDFISGIKDATSRQAFLSDMVSQGILVSDLKEVTNYKIKKKSGFFRSNKCKNLEDYFFQIGTLLNSGIPLYESNKIVADNISSQSDRMIILDTASKISEGMKFSDALALHNGYYEDFYINMIRSAERVGNLASVLLDIAEYEEEKKKNADLLKSAIIYPATVFTLGILILVFLLTVIVPRIEKIFSTAKAELPLATRILLSISGFIRDYGVLIFICFLLGVWLFRYYYRNNISFAGRVDKRLYGVHLISHDLLARFCHILSFQLKESIPLSEALKYASGTIKNRYLRESIERTRRAIIEGTKFSAAATEDGVLPKLLIAEISTAERSGNMHELLEKVSRYYTKQANKYKNLFLSIIEPLSIAAIGILVMFIVISIMLPLFNINTLIG